MKVEISNHYCTPGSNSVVREFHFKNRLIEEKIRGRGWGNWMKVTRRQNLPVIRQVSTRDVMYSKIKCNLHLCILYMKVC